MADVVALKAYTNNRYPLMSCTSVPHIVMLTCSHYITNIGYGG